MTLLRDNPPDALELWNKVTGETAPVVPVAERWPDREGGFWARTPDGLIWFKADGSARSRDLHNWIIRLDPEFGTVPKADFDALLAAAETAGVDVSKWKPRDPWLVHAREVTALRCEAMGFPLDAKLYRNGAYDRHPTEASAYLKARFGGQGDD